MAANQSETSDPTAAIGAMHVGAKLIGATCAHPSTGVQDRCGFDSTPSALEGPAAPVRVERILAPRFLLRKGYRLPPSRRGFAPLLNGWPLAGWVSHFRKLTRAIILPAGASLFMA
jgi:hypothetical protein